MDCGSHYWQNSYTQQDPSQAEEKQQSEPVDNSTAPSEFYEWKQKTKNVDETSELLGKALGSQNIVSKIQEEHNTFSLDMETWEKKHNMNRLVSVISEKSTEKVEENSKSKIKDYAYLPIGPIKSFKGVTSKYYLLKKGKFPEHLKFVVDPKHLDFQSIEICLPMYKNLTLKNIDKMRNIEITNISSESSQVSVDYDKRSLLIIRPGKKVSVKVTVNPEVKEPVSTVIVFQLRNGFRMFYLVKFVGIANSYGLEPKIIDKPRLDSSIVNFVMLNLDEEELELTISDVHAESTCKANSCIYDPTIEYSSVYPRASPYVNILSSSAIQNKDTQYLN